MASKFEQKFGRYAINNLTLYLIIGYAIGYIINIIKPEFGALLQFNPYAIMHGQIWRIVTWLITPPGGLGIFTIIMLLLYYSLGRSLEKTWGSYRYNVYLFSGFIFTIIGAFALYFILYYSKIDVSILQASGFGADRGMAIGSAISMYTTTYYINMSIFLAFAVTYPDEKLMLYFVIPIKIKWMGFVYAIFLAVDIFNAFRSNTVIGIVVAAMIVFSLLNFLIYFFTVRVRLKGTPMQRYKNAVRKSQFKQKVRAAQAHNTYENGARHKCAICGRTDLDNPNLSFRFCSKCSGNKEYCEDHLFTHQHN